jgi:hypothetical protein
MIDFIPSSFLSFALIRRFGFADLDLPSQDRRQDRWPSAAGALDLTVLFPQSAVRALQHARCLLPEQQSHYREPGLELLVRAVTGRLTSGHARVQAGNRAVLEAHWTAELDCRSGEPHDLRAEDLSAEELRAEELSAEDLRAE